MTSDKLDKFWVKTKSSDSSYTQESLYYDMLEKKLSCDEDEFKV